MIEAAGPFTTSGKSSGDVAPQCRARLTGFAHTTSLMREGAVDDGKALIRKAYEMARSSGKSDWKRMTVAVLKNRILQLTNREFRETKYGANTFLEFLKSASDIVRVDETARPAVAEYLSEPEPGGSEAPTTERFVRVRPDLWRAVMDYASGHQFVWEPATNSARETAPEEVSEGQVPENALPTISPDELSAWRGEFVAKHIGGIDGSTAARLEHWQKHRLPSTFLSSRLLGDWNRELKSRVAARLTDWFQTKGLPPPVDLVSVPPELPRREIPSDVAALRRLIAECVAVMTERELSDLRLPPAAVLRAQRARRQPR